MSLRLRTQLLQHIFKLSIVESDGLEFIKFVGSEFLTFSLSAMKTLFSHKKHNLIHDLNKCFEGSAPRMPLDRMPYGLLDYNIRFFTRHRTQKLGMEAHYALWLETMFAQFGHKWLRHIPGMYDPLKVGYHLSPRYFNSLYVLSLIISLLLRVTRITIENRRFSTVELYITM